MSIEPLGSGGSDGVIQTGEELRLFWDEWAEEPSQRAVAVDELAKLDNWLDEGYPHGVVLGESFSRRMVLASWVASLRARRSDVEVLFLPISPRLGMATERKALQLLYGQLEHQESCFSSPRSMVELRVVFQRCLGGRDDEERRLVVVVDGVDQCVGWGVAQLGRLARHVGDKVHILIGGPAETPSSVGTASWFEELGWDPMGFAVLSGIGAGTKRSRLPETELELARPLLEPLAAALAPVTPREVRWCFGVEDEHLRNIRTDAPPWLMFVRQDERGALRLVSDELHARLVSRWGTREWDCGVVDKTLRALVDRDSANIPGYAVTTLAEHMSRRGCSVGKWSLLVTKCWLEVWAKRHDALTGYLGDLEVARHAVQTDLLDQIERGKDVSGSRLQQAIGLVVRIVMCEAVLREKAGSFRNMPSCDGPYTQPQLNFEAPTKLRSLAVALLLGLEQEVRERAEEIRHLLENGPAAGGRPVPTPPRAFWRTVCERQVTYENIEAIRAAGDAFRLGWPSSTGGGAACLALGEERAWLLAEATSGIHRVESFADLARYVSPLRREEATTLAMDAFFEHGDEDTVPRVLGCATWMRPPDAILLMDQVLGRDPQADLERTLLGPSGILDCAALLARIGGPGAIVAVAEQVCEVVQWLGQEDAGE